MHKGWHSRGYLPHFDSSETIQFVTFRLADSLPLHVLQKWKGELDERFSSEEKKKREMRRRIEQFLDVGYGSCELKEHGAAEIAEQALLHFDNERYRLLSWVIMSNHVHAILEIWENRPLGKVLSSWKSFTSHEIGKINGRGGHFWQLDYFDRFIRDEEHYARAVSYIENNPVKAGLCENPFDWPYGSARRKSAD